MQLQVFFLREKEGAESKEVIHNPSILTKSKYRTLICE